MQKPLSRAVHISKGLIQSPVKLMASLPSISKDLGSKHCIFDSLSWECWRVSALNPALHSSILIAMSAVWSSTSSNFIIQVPPRGEGTESHFGTPLHPRMNSWPVKWSEMTSVFHRSAWHLRGFGIPFGLQHLPNCFTLQPSKFLMWIKQTSPNWFPWMPGEIP